MDKKISNSRLYSAIIENKIGIIGTLIFHIFLFIILLVFGLDKRISFVESEIIIQIPLDIENEIQEIQEKDVETKKEIEISKSVDELLKSIAVNNDRLKDKPSEQQSIDDIIKNIRNDISEDYYGSGDKPKEDISEFINDSLEIQKINNKAKKEIFYSGPSSVSYLLEGRTKSYLPIPVFKCEGQGRVVVTIKVTQKGRVKFAEISKSQTETLDKCLHEAAIDAAFKTRFNYSSKAPNIQVGSINYLFVKQ